MMKTVPAILVIALSAIGCGSSDEAPKEPTAATQGGNVVKTLPPGVSAGPSTPGGSGTATSNQ